MQNGQVEDGRIKICQKANIKNLKKNQDVLDKESLTLLRRKDTRSSTTIAILINKLY